MSGRREDGGGGRENDIDLPSFEDDDGSLDLSDVLVAEGLSLLTRYGNRQIDKILEERTNENGVRECFVQWTDLPP